MRQGFLYPVFGFVVWVLRGFNLVEYFKLAACIVGKYISKDETAERTTAYKSIGIDIYQIFKWCTILSLLHFGVSNWFCWSVVMYLIASNLFSYFYYHTWRVETREMSADRIKRRYVTFLFSIMFYLACYAYLYLHAYSGEIDWPESDPNLADAIYLSVANAFTFSGFDAQSQAVRMLYASELVNTFFFFSVILANSIPQITTVSEGAENQNQPN